MSGKFKSRANCMATYAALTGFSSALLLDRLVRGEFFWMSGYVVFGAFAALCWMTVARMTDEEYLKL